MRNLEMIRYVDCNVHFLMLIVCMCFATQTNTCVVIGAQDA